MDGGGDDGCGKESVGDNVFTGSHFTAGYLLHTTSSDMGFGNGVVTHKIVTYPAAATDINDVLGVDAVDDELVGEENAYSSNAGCCCCSLGVIS